MLAATILYILGAAAIGSVAQDHLEHIQYILEEAELPITAAQGAFLLATLWPLCALALILHSN